MTRNNQCFLVGNLGADPQERARSPKTGAVVGFTVAENVQSFDEESKTYQTVHTNWFQVTAFGSTAERVKRHLKKGDRVAIHGRMRTSKYNAKSGEERSGFEIVADQVALWKSLGAADEAPQAQPEAPRGTRPGLTVKSPARSGQGTAKPPITVSKAAAPKRGGRPAVGATEEDLPF